MRPTRPPQLPVALLLDMDGTLTEPLLDFPRIKAELGIGNRPILEALAEMDDAERQRCHRILERHEDHAADHGTLNPGCDALLRFAAERRIHTAVITRNSRRSVARTFAKHRLAFDVVLTGEDAPPKPDPAALDRAMERLGLGDRHRPRTWMVGDGHHDIEAGIAAGVPTAWISHGQRRDFAAEPTWVFRDLLELLATLKSLAS
jgi:HAD superfamily hydrolase (TIGR01549 family)